MNAVGFPTAFPGANSHRIVLYEPQKEPTDFERMEMLLADALSDARRALARTLSGSAYSALEPIVRDLRSHVERRRLLAQQAQVDLDRYLVAARRWTAAAEGPDPELDAAVESLARVQETVQRVLDLVGAERDVGWHRGIGR